MIHLRGHREGFEALRDAIFEHVPAEPAARGPRRRPPTASTGRARRCVPGGATRARGVPGEGERVERLIARHDVDNEEALRYVEERLRALGVIKALASAPASSPVTTWRSAASCSSSTPVRRSGEAFRYNPRMARAPADAVAAFAPRASACGGGGDDEEDVEETVRDFVQATNEPDEDAFCGEFVTQEFIEQSTGANGDEAARRASSSSTRWWASTSRSPRSARRRSTATSQGDRRAGDPGPEQPSARCYA